MQTVLVVEDDGLLRESYKRALTHAGYDVAIAADGKEGLVIATLQTPDAIVTGILMPKLNGFQMLEKLKSSVTTRQIPVIIVSALSRADDKQRALELGAVSYLVKNETYLRDIVHAVQNVLSSSATPKNSETVKNNELELLKYGFIGLAILALVATQSIDSFDFYMFVRWSMFIGFIASIWLIKRDEDRAWMILISIVGAFIFNPFSIVTNPKDWWIWVDLITAGFFGYLAYIAREERKQ